MEKTLEMEFKTANGGKKVISVSNPRENVTAAEAQAVMDAIVSGDVFETTTGKVVEAVEARMRSTEVVELQ